MKKVLMTLIVGAIATVTFAQAPIKVGKSQINVGVGLSSWGIPVYGGLDYGLTKDITIGGELSFRSYSDDVANVNYRHSILGVAANGNYHLNSLLNLPSKWNLYAGLNLGYYYWSSTSGYNGSGASGIGLGGQLGGRYYFNNKVGLNLEFGGGNAFSGGKLGLSIKL